MALRKFRKKKRSMARLRKRVVAYRAKKQSKVIGRGYNQILVYRPKCPQDIFPAELITTVYSKCRFNWTAGLINGGAAALQYHTIRGGNINLPFNASGNGGGSQFQQIATAVPAGSAILDGGFTINAQPSGMTTLSTIYDGYQVLSSEIEIVPAVSSATDTVKIYCYPAVCANQGNTTAPIVTENTIDEVKGLKYKTFNSYPTSNNGGNAKLSNKAFSHAVLGYVNLKDYSADYTGTGWSVLNVNIIPYNVWNWVVLYIMVDGGANAGAITFDYTLKYRVRWLGLKAFL